jgi:hemerythrin-like domain-containing protein
MKCINDLTQDHKVILRALEILEEIAFKLENSKPVDPPDVTAILRFLRTFADEHHQTKEESALFPVLRRTIEGREQPLRHMLFEHDQERSLMEALEDALNTNDGVQFGTYAHRLASLVRNHIDKEENILFEIVEKSLTPDQDEKVMEEFNNFQLAPGSLPSFAAWNGST